MITRRGTVALIEQIRNECWLIIERVASQSVIAKDKMVIDKEMIGSMSGVRKCVNIIEAEDLRQKETQ